MNNRFRNEEDELEEKEESRREDRGAGFEDGES